jgi:hypothetical protein
VRQVSNHAREERRMRRDEFLAEAARVRQATAERKKHLAREQMRLLKEAADKFSAQLKTQSADCA